MKKISHDQPYDRTVVKKVCDIFWLCIMDAGFKVQSSQCIQPDPDLPVLIQNYLPSCEQDNKHLISEGKHLWFQLRHEKFTICGHDGFCILVHEPIKAVCVGIVVLWLCLGESNSFQAMCDEV